MTPETIDVERVTKILIGNRWTWIKPRSLVIRKVYFSDHGQMRVSERGEWFTCGRALDPDEAVPDDDHWPQIAGPLADLQAVEYDPGPVS